MIEVLNISEEIVSLYNHQMILINNIYSLIPLSKRMQFSHNITTSKQINQSRYATYTYPHISFHNKRTDDNRIDLSPALKIISMTSFTPRVLIIVLVC